MMFDVWVWLFSFWGRCAAGTTAMQRSNRAKVRTGVLFLLYYCSRVAPSRFCGGGCCSGALTTTLVAGGHGVHVGPPCPHRHGARRH
jgi:hypothetical protein